MLTTVSVRDSRAPRESREPTVEFDAEDGLGVRPAETDGLRENVMRGEEEEVEADGIEPEP